MIFLPPTNTVILLEPYCGTITEPGSPVLWLAERHVCIREHGCDLRYFAFRVLITQARIWKSLKSFLVENSTSLLYLPIPLSDETWKIFTNMLCQFLFSLTLTFYANPYFGMHLFFKTRTDYACKTSRLVRISLLSSAITKSFAFSLGKVN